ncbi:threonine/homoserine efflux transporter RhtA [Paraburkholderia sp. BL23I1N1]|uniref:DMT family transporter n=1 Tax=Paraburkholderia sp. BL23I1N1 TaxID=1938802 RepID=UPI000E7718B5|nr:DMT family transporter [Paraburkholderia sp. BL23I1N1]RKE26300.1 threonine/homoserine efflux transporter RhtA [Paraburkholderia sp. BL23I1N1]
MSRTPSNSLRGIALLLISQFLLVSMDATAKKLSLTISVPLLVWARYTVHLALMVLFFVPSRGRSVLATKSLPTQICRGLLLLATSIFGLVALHILPMAETAGLAFMSPLIATILAGPWLGERVGRVGWCAISVGALGAILISRPSSHLPIEGVLLVLASAVSFSFYQILTRKLSQTEDSVTMLFYTALVGTVCLSVALPWFRQGATPTWTQTLAILSLGVYAGLGHFCVIRAFRYAPVSTLTPFMYVQLVWAALLGWIIFGHFPDGLSIVGIFIVVGGGLLLSFTRRTQIAVSIQSPGELNARVIRQTN